MAALVAEAPYALTASSLIKLIWGNDPPARPEKTLQVLVSRVRSRTHPSVIASTDTGYRLGDVSVDLLRLRALVASGDVDDAHAALAIPCETQPEGVTAEVVENALRLRDQANRTLALAGHIDAAAEYIDVTDEPVAAMYLRQIARERGVPAALAGFEEIRGELLERTGASPGAALQALHAELLARESPVRTGIGGASTTLVGRDLDIDTVRTHLRDHRVVTIVGSGGLGKTRLARAVAAQAEQPIARFVELASVVSAEDVLPTLGSELGVRDSVAVRRALTAEQRADVRSRLAAMLDQAPTLLILDNCEQVVGAVADVVAWLIANTDHVRVMTTSRAPLGIAAEQVYPLEPLTSIAAVDLFIHRAQVVRPQAALGPETVRLIVDKCECLPLALELAAAKVRVMSVEQINERLANRFVFLQGAERSSPDRHRTLLAVIDWSWNLLSPAEQHALATWSVFHDGLTVSSAAATLGQDPEEALTGLVDQSLLSVIERDGTVRFRMLEMVREFALMQLTSAGDETSAYAARSRWARELCREHRDDLSNADQINAVDAIAVEEANLADVLRFAIAHSDVETAVVVIAALGTGQSVASTRGSWALGQAFEDLMRDWTPTSQYAEDARLACSVLLLGPIVGVTQTPTESALRALQTVGPDSPQPRLAALCWLLLSQAPHHDEHGDGDDLDAAPGRELQALKAMIVAHSLEDAGDMAGAIDSAQRALSLITADTPPWDRAMRQAQLMNLYVHHGVADAAIALVEEAVGVLERLHASDDVLMVRAALVQLATATGDLDRAHRS